MISFDVLKKSQKSRARVGILKTPHGEVETPSLVPVATWATVKTLDSREVFETKSQILIANTYHLHLKPGEDIVKNGGGLQKFMNCPIPMMTDSGGFQVMSLAKTLGGKNSVTDIGVNFKMDGKKILFTPEISIKTQLAFKTDMIVVLDDFTDPKSNLTEAKDSVRRTLLWAENCKKIFEANTKSWPKRPYLLGVVQGGRFASLRKTCTRELVNIGFDGLGYGGWPMNLKGSFDHKSADIIRQNTPDSYFLYGLGIGKPQDITSLVKSSWHIFDCVLPTRDARHNRLYVRKNASSLDYSYYIPDKSIHFLDKNPISRFCDCHLCQNYSRSYLAHLFRIKEMTALRLATIHNLRFYSELMRKLRHV